MINEKNKFSEIVFMSYDRFGSQLSDVLGIFYLDFLVIKQRCAMSLSEFFFVRFLVFELWSILYFAVVNNVGLSEKLGRVYC